MSARPTPVTLVALLLVGAVRGQDAAPPLLSPPGAIVLLDGIGDPGPTDRLGNFELHVDFWQPTSGVAGRMEIGPRVSIELRGTSPGWHRLELHFRHERGRAPVRSLWLDGLALETGSAIPEAIPERAVEGLRQIWTAAETPDLSAGRFAFAARFRGTGDGTLVAKAPPDGEWAPRGKSLFVRGGRLVYDIGWVGALGGRTRVDDDRWHTAVLTYDGTTALLFVDGKLDGEQADFAEPDAPGHVLKVGATSTNFGGGYTRGEIAEVAVFDAPLSRDTAKQISTGTNAMPAAPLRWVPDGDQPVIGPDDVVRQRVRLTASDPATRFANLWVRPLGPVDHAALIAGWDAAALERGRSIYASVCIACHGADGEKVILPTARPFSLAKLENGADPLSMFKTLTDGFRQMPPQTWMTPAQRYDVIHYVREQFLRERNPTQYVAADARYLAALPKVLPPDPDDAARADQLAFRDYGPALVAQVGGAVPVGMGIALPSDVTIAYDLHRMGSVGAWRGAFLELSNTQHHRQRGEGIAQPGATPWSWSTPWLPSVDESRKPPRGPSPAIRRIGHYTHGRDLVLSYAVHGRAVLEAPTAIVVGDQVALVHRFRIAAGDAPLTWKTASGADGHHAIVRGEPTVIASDGQLRVPVSTHDLVFTVFRTRATTEVEREAFGAFVAREAASLELDPGTWTHGGPSLWPKPLITRGTLGEPVGGYAMDTLTLPDGAPLGAWLRTSALDFFSDGRAALSTLGGDVWVVDGIDDTLRELRWHRFATGLFEPLGLLVVDDQVHVTCRDGLFRLHDLDADGAADFYECVYADVDVSPTFHAFNFDLQRTPDGALCYVKSGRYTDFTLPGAVVAVAPDGTRARYVATGFRTPNGMGVLPDGALTVSDNQGNWVPASKVSKIRADGFYGVFRGDARERPDFDRPFIWLPQDVDSSSGGQLWLGDPRFGPLAGHLLHTSFGKGFAYALTLQQIGDVTQASCVTLPFQFAAGVQRARTNPQDGQVYLVGLSGWQGPAGGADGCLQRLRWTKHDATGLLGATVTAEGVELQFSGPIATADAARFRAEQWNYRWTPAYGSAQWSVREPERQGHDELAIRAVTIAADRTRIELQLSVDAPVDQLRIVGDATAADGRQVHCETWLTVHVRPGR